MADKKSILSYFPRHLRPREVQSETLRSLEKSWDSGNIFVINLPVASGKSSIALTIMQWAKKAAVITPNKLLVDQYNKEYPYLHVLRSKADYYCSTFRVTVDRRPKSKKHGNLCKPFQECEGCTKYLHDVRKARSYPYLLANYYIYLAYKLYREILIVDEAHNLIPTIKSFASKKLWQFKYHFPSNLDTREKIKRWALENYERYKYDEGFMDLYKELTSPNLSYLVRMTIDTWAKTKEPEEWPVIKMEPLDIRGNPAVSFMFPSQVKKIVLLSGTISRKDIEQLGLSDRKIIYIEADSPISADRRPVTVPAEAMNMSYREQDKNLPNLAEYIINLAKTRPDEKGLVHITYNLSEKLKTLLSASEIRDRLIWHNRDNKKQQYLQFRDTSEPKILIASGMYEGIDLPYDACRWQVVSKVPWPSLADPAIKFMSELDSEWYAWETSKTIQQAIGRVCRTLTDFGETFIFDRSFIRLYSQNLTLYPKWLQESITIEQ